MAFFTLLIANRGEIACRIIRTARGLGYRTVAVFSDADAHGLHVREADAAVAIGPAPAAESYLRGDVLIEAARRSGADALHPGYGFLSENAAFAQACLDAGLVFIGPPPAAIAAMGDKARAKRRMIEAGVPCLPGFLGDDEHGADDTRLQHEAEAIGFPLLVKARAGGGGRGMRLVREPAQLGEALAGARREALRAFGDDTLMLEHLIEGGRHIEVQVFGDAHGTVIHLGERDCSTQRRRQKIIEEAPAPALGDLQRETMSRDAIAAARAVGYVGAGTVEFIVDAQGRHYFLEMNTRLQVEHPVTEMITGLDLVEWQLRIAAGERLPLPQALVKRDGHAIEVRLCAEDPAAGFAPQTGSVLHWRPAAALPPGVRIDHGLAEGDTIGPFYDPLLAKLVAHGRDRDDAIRRLRAALRAAPLLGITTNARLLSALLASEEFRASRLFTQTLDDWSLQGHALLQADTVDDEAWCVAAALFVSRDGLVPRPQSVASYDLDLACGAHVRRLRMRIAAADAVQIGEGDALRSVRWLDIGEREVRYEWQGVQRRATRCWQADRLHLALDDGIGRMFDEPRADRLTATTGDGRRALAPVAGVVARVAVQAGDDVTLGLPLVCVEAMKIEQWVAAPRAGRVEVVHVTAGQQVAAGLCLIELAPQD
jgi:geranyl-CoA carboxylase alpha subunit